MKTELELVNLCVLNVGYAQTKHQWGGTDISSPFLRLYYIKGGHATLHLPTGRVELVPGYMYLIPNFMPHSYDCDPGFEFYYMFIHERYAERNDLFDIYDFPIEVKANDAIDLLFTNYCQLYPQLSLPSGSAEDFNAHPTYRDYAERYSNMERYEKMQLQGLVWIVGSYFMKHTVKKADFTDPRLLKVCQYVKAHIADNVDFAAMADIACVTKAHLGRLFRESLQISPVQFVIRSKIRHAQGLLLTTNMSIKEVARAIGIDDHSYFIRQFKKQLGFTPQKYRMLRF